MECLPLIAASIMSKKIAGGADRIVLDVKVGPGGFMPVLDGARALAEMMVALGREFGRGAVAVLSSMQQPLGLAIGNALEVREALATLSGKGRADLTELCLQLGAQMLIAGGVVPTLIRLRPAGRKAAAGSGVGQDEGNRCRPGRPGVGGR